MPLEALQQILPKTEKRARKIPKYFGFGNDDSSRESTNSCSPNLKQPREKKKVGDIDSVQPSVVQSIVETAARVEPIFNLYTFFVIREVSPTDPCIRPASHSSEDNFTHS